MLLLLLLVPALAAAVHALPAVSSRPHHVLDEVEGACHRPLLPGGLGDIVNLLIAAVPLAASVLAVHVARPWDELLHQLPTLCPP